MGYLEDFAAALAGEQAQQQIAAANPYYGLQAAPNAYLSRSMQLVGQNPTQYSNKEKYGSALIGGLLSGMLGGVGDNYQATLTDRYNNALLGSMTGQPVVDEGLPSKLFKQATTQGSLFGIRRGLQRQDAQFEARLANDSKLQQKLLDLGYVVGADGNLQKSAVLDPIAMEEDKARAKVQAELGAKRDFYGADSKNDPDSPSYKVAKEAENKTYDRIKGLPAYAQFADIHNNFQTLLALTKEDSPSASIGMISALARIWDPQGTVREGEYQINKQAQSALDAAYGDWRRIVEGKGTLGPDAKRSIISAASQKYNEFGKAYDTERQKLYTAMELQGGNRQNIPTMDFSPYDIASFQAPGAIPEGMKLQRNVKTGETRLVPR